jgi:hypothetical protein
MISWHKTTTLPLRQGISPIVIYKKFGVCYRGNNMQFDLIHNWVKKTTGYGRHRRFDFAPVGHLQNSGTTTFAIG